MTRHSNINGFKMNDYYRTASIQDYFSTKTNKECILFPTYAKRNPNNRNEWIVKAKGWALSHNCSFAKQKVVMGITKSVAGKSFTDSTSLQTFEERFKYFLATNQKSKSFTIQAIDVIASLEMMNNFIPTFLLPNQHYILPSHHSSLSQQDEDNTDYPMRPQNPMASILDQLDIESSTPVDQDNSNTAIQLKTSNSGFFLGEFVLAHDTILAWAQAHNQRDARLIRIQSTSTDQTKSFSPTRGVVSLVESYGISIVSDIDDTIKDTRILAGARKVLSKTFFEQPKDVEGMADVYMTWYNQGASFHYVSNSPFQLVPMLDQFIRDAHFPPGSMHLRDDLSLLSRLVEIPGQAKREAILDIIRDFPQRRFILIGDSGEIDLEIYTKIAFEYPKQVLKIFIRDVTTPLAEEQERKKMHKRMSQSSFLPTFSRRESLVDDDDLFTLQSQHSIPSSSHKKKFQSPLGLRKAVRSTLMEYAVEPHMTGHRTDFHMDGDDDIGLINPHRHHQISTAEACKRLYERVEKARLQIPDVDIVLFQDAQILQNDKYIQDALWNMKSVTDDTLSYRFFK